MELGGVYPGLQGRGQKPSGRRLPSRTCRVTFLHHFKIAGVKQNFFSDQAFIAI
ncbi:hypothetical protein DFAR_2360018 [Desulfarculales bacterium]